MTWTVNGLREPSEPGLTGAVVELFDTADGIVGNGNDRSVGVQITDEAGSYRFADVADSDQYYLSFRPPAGLTFTLPNAGDESVDSDADSLGVTEVFSLVGPDDEAKLDAGLLGTLAPFGFAFTLGAELEDYGTEVTRSPGRQSGTHRRVQWHGGFRSWSGSCHKNQRGRPRCVRCQLYSGWRSGLGSEHRRPAAATTRMQMWCSTAPATCF